MDRTTIEGEMRQGIAVFRVAAWAWAFVVALASVGQMRNVALGFGLVGAAAAVTASWFLPRWRRLGIGAEPIVAAALLAGDGLVFELDRPQSLAGAWPLAALLVAATSDLDRALRLAIGLGLARGVGAGLLAQAWPWSWSASTLLSVLSTTVLFCVAAWAATYVTGRIGKAEDEAAFVRARERVAGDLHDGMLQTLAAVQRRTDDSSLVQLARAQEADLRAYLYGDADASDAPASLEGIVRAVIQDLAVRFGMRVEVALVPPTPAALPQPVATALRGALMESLNNAAKHSGAGVATVYGEVVDGSLHVSVRDRGTGFDLTSTPLRGLESSVCGRVRAVGGEVDIASSPGAGTDVRIVVPLGRAS